MHIPVLQKDYDPPAARPKGMGRQKTIHIPVLQKEVLEYLDPKPNENFIDCTVGEGGHTAAILEKNGPNGKVLGIEIDRELYLKLQAAEIKNQKSKIKNRLILINDSYINLKEIVERENFKNVSGILFDLGLSSWHLEESGRGFSFLKNEPLDMRYTKNSAESILLHSNGILAKKDLTAERIVNEWPEEKIEKILKEYGEERFAKKIAKRIVIERRIKPIKTTFQLVEIIKRAIPRKYRFGRLHPATRTFQALRIAVNDELENIKKVLPKTLEVLEPGGRLVVISFHSLEDRIIKNFLKENKEALRILTKKPIRPSQKEINLNPRSRSAKLRAAIKI